jgi:hypothetical protein
MCAVRWAHELNAVRRLRPFAIDTGSFCDFQSGPISLTFFSCIQKEDHHGKEGEESDGEEGTDASRHCPGIRGAWL